MEGALPSAIYDIKSKYFYPAIFWGQGVFVIEIVLWISLLFPAILFTYGGDKLIVFFGQ
jgi:hypothetical protein